MLPWHHQASRPCHLQHTWGFLSGRTLAVALWRMSDIPGILSIFRSPLQFGTHSLSCRHWPLGAFWQGVWTCHSQPDLTGFLPEPWGKSSEEHNALCPACWQSQYHMNVNKFAMSPSPARLGFSNLCIQREESISLDRKKALPCYVLRPGLWKGQLSNSFPLGPLMGEIASCLQGTFLLL